jgi:tetratricopeptide (TPR) repeat protein
MRSVFAFFLGLAMAAAPALPSLAQTPPEPQAVPSPAKAASRLDTLFGNLKRERNERAAERIASQIQDEWNESGSASIDLMMQWSQQAMAAQKFDIALDFLDQVTTLAPSYAEGWNRRATVHFMMHNFRKSMSDIDRTLRLEPRHFGALAGMAQIMTATGNKQLALEAWQRVLTLYPMMRNAQDQVATLSEELAGEAI